MELCYMRATFFIYIQPDLTLNLILLEKNILKASFSTSEMAIHHWSRLKAENLHDNFDQVFIT